VTMGQPTQQQHHHDNDHKHDTRDEHDHTPRLPKGSEDPSKYTVCPSSQISRGNSSVLSNHSAPQSRIPPVQLCWAGTCIYGKCVCVTPGHSECGSEYGELVSEHGSAEYWIDSENERDHKSGQENDPEPIRTKTSRLERVCASPNPLYLVSQITLNRRPELMPNSMEERCADRIMRMSESLVGDREVLRDIHCPWLALADYTS
jgi:hypothetical protein